MMRVTFELLPGGMEEHAELLGRIEIANDILGTVRSDGKRGTYHVKLWKKRARVWRNFVIRDYPRKTYHPWELIRRILNEAAEANGGHI